MKAGSVSLIAWRWGAKAVIALAGLGLAGCGAALPAQHALRLVRDDTTISVYGLRAAAQEVPILRYRYAGLPPTPSKPYVKEFYSPAGVNVLRDMVPDHLHHHGLMFAVQADDVNTWPESQGSGSQVHRDLTGLKTDALAGLRRATWTQLLDWRLPGSDRTALTEQRTIEVYRGSHLDAALLTWESCLSAPGGKPPVTLRGSEYYGLGVRFVQSMDKNGEHFNADGKVGVEGTNGARSDWCAYTAEADGHPVTVALFDHPNNPRHPATWYTLTKGFAYVSATLNLKNEPLTLAPSQPVVLRYGVAIWDGRAQPEVIKALYRKWTSMLPTATTDRAMVKNP